MKLMMINYNCQPLRQNPYGKSILPPEAIREIRLKQWSDRIKVETLVKSIKEQK